MVNCSVSRIILLTILTVSFSWLLLMNIAYFTSTSTATSTVTNLTHLPNREVICGEGVNKERENLFYFDLSSCAGLRADTDKCRTNQVCVTDCPTNYWTFTKGKDPNIRRFCQPELTEDVWRNHDIRTLVEMEQCPPYLLPSSLINGLCLPYFALISGDEAEEIATIVERIQVSNVRMLNPDRLQEGSMYALDKVVNRGFAPFTITSSGTFTSLTHLPNSRGELCGEGAQNKGRENLLYFDVSRCAGLRADNEICRSNQICITDCPTEYWTYTQGKDPNLRQFCQPDLTDDEWTSLDVLTLIQKQLCPPYLLPSTSLNGLCLPDIGLASPEKAVEIATIIERIQVSNVQMLNPKQVLEGSVYALKKVANRGFLEKSVQDFLADWPFLFLAIILSWLIFLQTLVIVSHIRQGLFLITVSTAAILMSVAILSFKKYAQLQGIFENQTNSSTWLIIALFNVTAGFIMIILPIAYFLFYKCQRRTKIRNIKDKCREAMKVKLLFLIPLTTALLQISTVSFSLFASISLATTSKTPEFRVVGACQEELCINNNTNKFFKEGDICQLEQFRDCTRCPNAECIFHSFSNGSPGKETRDFLHIINFVGLLLFLPLIEAIGNMVIAKFIAEEKKSLRREFPDEHVHLRLLEPPTFLLHFANSLFLPFLVFQEKQQSQKQLDSISDERIQWILLEQDPLNTSSKSSKDEEEMDQERPALQMTLFAAKIFSVSFASIITFTILIHSQDSVLDMELTYRWLFILALWLTPFSTLSSFTSYIVTVNNPFAFNCPHAETEEDVVLRDKETPATPPTS